MVVDNKNRVHGQSIMSGKKARTLSQMFNSAHKEIMPEPLYRNSPTRISVCAYIDARGDHECLIKSNVRGCVKQYVYTAVYFELEYTGVFQWAAGLFNSTHGAPPMMALRSDIATCDL
jgi:hypothetical protein